MKVGTETMEKFYQAEHRSCSDFESKCLDNNNSTDEDTTIFVQAGKKKQQNAKYTKLKKTESHRKVYKTEKNMRYDRFKVKTKRKRRCCPLPTIAFCFCWFILVFITFITLLKFTKPGNFPMRKSYHWHQSTDEVFSKKKETSVRPCDDFEVTTVWNSQYNGFMSESAIRLIDVNQDGVDDIITGFTSDSVQLYNTTSFCSSGNVTYSCSNGGIAIDGKSGMELWIHYTKQEVFAINCNGDITFDGVPDCLLAGRAGVLVAVDGKTGESIWSFKDQPVYTDKMNLYTGQFIQDLDDDGVMEVLQTNGGDIFAEAFSKTRKTGRIMIISGKSGEVLRWMEMPDKKETYFSPVVYTVRNGTDMVVFGTGGETHGGALYVIQLHHLYRGEIDLALQIHKDESKGIMNPPVLVDLNKDGTVDMVLAFFNSTIAAIDGENFSTIWSYSVPNSETYSMPSPGYFNKDETVDFMIKMNIGPGFPTYYRSIVSVIDGLSGKPIINPLTSSVATFDSPLSISMEGDGNDLFLFWMGDCLSHEGHTELYGTMDPGIFDSCKLRFKTKETHKLCITNRARKGACHSTLQTEYNHLEGQLHTRKRRHSPSGFKYDSGKMHSTENDFVQRVMGTGALMQSLGDKVGVNHDAIDFVFAEVWLKSLGQGITKRDIRCIEKYNKEYGMAFFYTYFYKNPVYKIPEAEKAQILRNFLRN